MAKNKAKRAREEAQDRAFINDNDGEELRDDEEGPPVIDPYEVLALDKDAKADDVKKAYRKMALKHHPDKAPATEKEAANTHFQQIAFAYAILSDARRRKRYDLTGSTTEVLDDSEAEGFDWLSFYREQFENVVTEESIKRISDEYKGSEKERQDVLDAYTKYKGRLDAVYEAVLLSDVLEDDERFCGIIDEAVAGGRVERFEGYERGKGRESREKVMQRERVRRMEWDRRKEDEEKEEDDDAATAGAAAVVSSRTGKAKKPKAKKNKTAAAGPGGGMADLAAMIQQRQKARHGNDFFEKLEARYATSSSGRGAKRATPMDEPSEEAFAAMGARKKSRAAGRGKGKVAESEGEDVEMEDEDIEVESEVESEVEVPKKKGRSLRRGGRKKA